MTFEQLKSLDVSKHPIDNEPDCIHRLIEMAWQDRTPFEAIKREFSLGENEVKHLMRRHISAQSFKRWRKRVQGRSTKHHKKLDIKITRFQGPW